MSENKVRKPMRTRCYYTDYVNHMIRFFLTTPDTLHIEGKRKADVQNWMAVQAVWHGLSEDNKKVLTDIYSRHHWITEAVRLYCQDKGAEPERIWVLITKTGAAIAKRRGLI